MLGDQLPAVVVSRIDFRIGALEERNVCLVPVEVAIVPEGLGVEELLLVEDLCMQRRRGKKNRSDEKCDGLKGAEWVHRFLRRQYRAESIPLPGLGGCCTRRR